MSYKQPYPISSSAGRTSAMARNIFSLKDLHGAGQQGLDLRSWISIKVAWKNIAAIPVFHVNITGRFIT